MIQRVKYSPYLFNESKFSTVSMNILCVISVCLCVTFSLPENSPYAFEASGANDILEDYFGP